MSEHIINTMKSWVSNVIVKYNFCPFARKEVEQNAIHYHISEAVTHDDAVMDMLEQCFELNQNKDRETTLLMFSHGFTDFNAFLDLVDLANAMLCAQGFEGIYQIANFHPDYVFADSDEDDPANYTNRAPYPTLHLIREDSMAAALEAYEDPESIPDNNIRLARRKGEAFWQQLLASCTHKK
ncbi:DUF1415 domain-containing protein [Pseudoalteromonas luteoviolacea]|uniref:Uncharacterized protein n=1 Tax=Pseudoalteromonas luteoviolacea S4054 TaxID=1129367 RepID=A0A0F6AHX1_9GAMM|nr:DUF1415 domain-containing protein [Pseudoalteromonas luteoviolacea]AOT07199.1 hypothetical protein S4054249_04705 [Pseudoalteromonas luteoviolacea]AOT12115.1 hypothetical protein S40542_04705 [Pseudoalteromonas luteoviolacea]AOT17028.1 hypothetical protein S4054_04705 [Pseudoalteromonas luteoviolacea]KKE85376.1 hypothetical protein N479_05075 [Pseudoalteromonas luteoviolacea S4054]KZN73724.1 hypothetical protein N481_11485 [Pseudoalteromonas luteoviolacea S4047-1]